MVSGFFHSMSAKSINYNTPVIINHAQEGLEFSPISVMRTFSIRKKSAFLKQAIYADVDIQPVNLSDLPAVSG